jgi:hypothetical protein
MEESQFWSVHVAQLVTMLLNQTQLSFLTLCVPYLWQVEMRKKTWKVTEQLARRSIILGPYAITPDHILPFLAPLGLNGSTMAAAALAAGAANQFGGFATVKEAIAEMQEIGEPSLENWRTALTYALENHGVKLGEDSRKTTGRGFTAGRR